MRSSQAILLAALTIGLVPQRSFAADPHEGLADFTLTSWTKKDGLAAPIRSIAQDTSGYLWLATDEGLIRFDGIRFVTWESLGGSPLPHAPLQTLCASSDGGVWIGFGETGGIAQIHGKAVRTFGAPAGMPSADVGSMVEDRARTIWAGTSAGLFRLVEGKWQKLGAAQGLADAPVTAVYVDTSGTLWVATDAGVFWQPIATEESFQSIDPSSNDIRGLSEDATGRIWATDSSGGFRTLGYRTALVRGSEAGRGLRVAHDRTGDLWVATLGQGLWRVKHTADPSKSTVEKTTVMSGLSNDAVRALFEDRDGNIWAGTSEGLDRLTPHRVTPMIGLGLVNAVASTRDGRVWAATADNLRPFSRVEGTWQPDGNSWPIADTKALRVDATGGVWAATPAGLFRLANNRLSRVMLPGDQPSAVDAIAADARGGVWIIRGQDIFHWEADRLELFDRLPALDRAQATSAAVDRNNQLWIAFSGSRVGVLGGRGQFRVYTAQDGLGNGPYYAIFEDVPGAVWIGGSDGLSRFADGTFSRVTRANGIPAGGVFAIEEDEQGELWLATSSGILRLDRTEFDAAVAKNLYQIRYRLYDPSDGLAGFPESRGDMSAARAADGALWFVTSRGLTIADPRQLVARHDPMRVNVESVSADGRRLEPTPEVALPPGTKTLEIDYTAPSLTFPLKTHFRYRLEGFDADWIDAGTRRQALYANLPARPYRFRVTSTDEDGNWLESDTAWAFAIRPMLYQTPWFYTMVAGVLAAAIWGAWRFRERQLRRDFSLVLGERVRLSWELHDTLLQSLVGVALQFDAVAKTLDASPAAARAHVVRVREQVEEYIREARRSIWALRSPALDTRELGEALREAGARITTDHPVGFEFATEGTPARYPPEVEHQILRIGQEAVLNAVRHAHATKIRMELNYRPHAVALKVSDDGIGFEPGRRRGEAGDHYGITTMRERAQQIGGQLTIESVPHGGTVVETVVPMTLRGQSLES